MTRHDPALGGAGEQVGTCSEDTPDLGRNAAIDLGAAALDYAARGWPVFPLHHPVLFGPKKVSEAGHAMCSCRRPDCEHQGKHPRTPNGLKDATTDVDTVKTWWAKWPDANIGIRTGVAFDVLDLDGEEALDAIDAVGPDGCGTVSGPVVLTGRGVHIYVLPTGAGNREAMVPSVDWRGAEGYVVAPPSLHYLHGDRYVWGPTAGPDEILEPCPTWLEDLVLKRGRQPDRSQPGAPSHAPGHGGSRYGLRALEGELGRLAMANEGTRNKALVTSSFRIGRLVAGGELEPLHATVELLKVADRIGLPSGEAERTVESGLTAGMANPRSAS